MITAERTALLAVLQHTLGYTFHNLHLLNGALTHRSYANEMAQSDGDYERLEFLGDVVLSLIVSAHLYELYPTYSEGLLSKLRASLVSQDSLATLARRVGLGHFLLVGRGEEQTGGRDKSSLLAAAFEAIIAALYLDAGLPVTQKVFLGCFAADLACQWAMSVCGGDYKGLLQEQALSTFGTLPQYHLVHEEGPAHQKIFHVQLTLNRDYGCIGVGRSKKAAEQHAAKQLLALLQHPAS